MLFCSCGVCEHSFLHTLDLVMSFLSWDVVFVIIV